MKLSALMETNEKLELRNTNFDEQIKLLTTENQKLLSELNQTKVNLCETDKNDKSKINQLTLRNEELEQELKKI